MTRKVLVCVAMIAGLGMAGGCANTPPSSLSPVSPALQKLWPQCCSASLTKVGNNGTNLVSDMQTITNQDMTEVRKVLYSMSSDVTTAQNQASKLTTGLPPNDPALNDVKGLESALGSAKANIETALSDCNSPSDKCKNDIRQIGNDLTNAGNQSANLDADSGASSN